MNTTNASEAIPSSQAFTLVGITYGLYSLGLFMLWPAVIGAAIAYVKRQDVPELLASHYRWLIGTFWWWLVAWVVIIGAMLAVLIPNAIEIEGAVQSGEYFNIPWELIGAAVLGGIGLSIVWLWVIYRLIRGAIRMSDGRAAPGRAAP
ncbi:MAG: hypothetical protein M3496_00600 [Pseudomonadota bacterium]|nr:hypothetical protein [Burkholderiaceae bacterium]MDQ3444665.1 hypothetical protein [Pseudomonadota bacterium]